MTPIPLRFILQLRPRGLILRRLCSAMLPQLPEYAPVDLAQTLWSLQRLRFQPDVEWMMDAQLAVRSKLALYDLQSLVMLLSAFGGYTFSTAKSTARRRQVQVWMCDRWHGR